MNRLNRLKNFLEKKFTNSNKNNVEILNDMNDSLVLNSYFDVILDTIPSSGKYIMMLNRYDKMFEKFKRYLTPTWVSTGETLFSLFGRLSVNEFEKKTSSFISNELLSLCKYMKDNKIYQKEFFLFSVKGFEIACIEDLKTIKLPFFLFLNDIKHFNQNMNLNSISKNLDSSFDQINNYNNLINECKQNPLILNLIKKYDIQHNIYLEKLNNYYSQINNNQQNILWNPNNEANPYDRELNTYIKYKALIIRTIFEKWEKKMEEIFSKTNLNSVCKTLIKTGGKKRKSKNKKTMKKKN